MAPLPKATVQNAITQLYQGKSCREVSNNLNISFSSVQRIRKKNKEHIPILKVGCPSKITKATQRVLARKFDTGKLETLKDGQ